MQRFTVVALAAIVLGMPGWIPAAFAQPVTQADDSQFDGDAPEHGVARMGVVTGDVSVQRGDTGEVVAAEQNTPLVALDHVLTGPDGRTELQLDYGNFMRVAPNSEVRLGELKDNSFLLQIAEGTITYRILRDSQAVVEISTPGASIRPTQQGTYRVTVREDGSAEITVRRGLAQIYEQQGSLVLSEGRTLEVSGDPANPQISQVALPAIDDWDRWNQSRDQALEQTKSYSYVSRDIDGAEDLDANGQWAYDASYGNVWVPNVSDDWAPYRDGRWVDVDYYGWTWLSSDPWGWAPYHYGSWYQSPYGWAWYPGVIGTRYHWRPAMVAFIGWGNGVNGGFGYGNVGWVPLAPFERYRPWYGVNRGVSVGGRSTIVNNVNIVNIYRNANNANAITSVRTADFGRRGINRSSYVRASIGELSRAGRVNGPLGITATPESHRYSERPVSATALTRGTNSTNSRFNVESSRFGHNPVPANGTNGGRAGGRNPNAGGFGQGTPTPPAASGATPAGPRNGGGRSGGFQGNPNSNSTSTPNPNSAGPDRNGGTTNGAVPPRRAPIESPERVTRTPPTGITGPQQSGPAAAPQQGGFGRAPRTEPSPQNVQRVAPQSQAPIQAPRVQQRSAPVPSPAPTPNIQRPPAPAPILQRAAPPPAPAPMRAAPPPPAPAPMRSAPPPPAPANNPGGGQNNTRKR